MNETSPVHPVDLLGFSRLAVDGTVRMTDLVEAMHHAITGAPGIRATPDRGTASRITGLVYDSIRAITGLVGGGIDATLIPLIPMLRESRSTPKREAVLAVLNGVMGDYLAATHNPLAISMRLRRKGQPLTLEMPALAAAIPRPGGKLLLLVHGLCMSDRQWTRKGHNQDRQTFARLLVVFNDRHVDGVGIGLAHEAFSSVSVVHPGVESDPHKCAGWVNRQSLRAAASTLAREFPRCSLHTAGS